MGKKAPKEWKDDIVGFKRLSFWYVNFSSRGDLESYFESFRKQVGLPDKRQVRSNAQLVFGRNASLEDLIAEIPGSSFFGPKIQAELDKHEVLPFNSAILLDYWRPPDETKLYHSRKLKHLGFVPVRWNARSIAEKQGANRRNRHDDYHSVWLCNFKTLRSLKGFFHFPTIAKMPDSRFYKLTQPGFYFEEELTSLNFFDDHSERPVRDVMRTSPKHSQHSPKEIEAIVKLCEAAGHSTTKAVFVASGYNHDETIAHGSALGRTEIPECQYVGSFKLSNKDRKKKRS